MHVYLKLLHKKKNDTKINLIQQLKNLFQNLKNIFPFFKKYFYKNQHHTHKSIAPRQKTKNKI